MENVWSDRLKLPWRQKLLPGAKRTIIVDSEDTPVGNEEQKSYAIHAVNHYEQQTQYVHQLEAKVKLLEREYVRQIHLNQREMGQDLWTPGKILGSLYEEARNKPETGPVQQPSHISGGGWNDRPKQEHTDSRRITVEREMYLKVMDTAKEIIRGTRKEPLHLAMRDGQELFGITVSPPSDPAQTPSQPPVDPIEMDLMPKENPAPEVDQGEVKTNAD